MREDIVQKLKDAAVEYGIEVHRNGIMDIDAAEDKLFVAIEQCAAELIEQGKADAAQPERDYKCEIARLTDCLKKANTQAEHFEREWYLRGDEIERLMAPPAPVLEGWKLVPIKPTLQMINALVDADPEHDSVWDAALAAAPHAAQRQPLTDEQIDHLLETRVGTPCQKYPLEKSDWVQFARTIEAAHGIMEVKP